MADFEKIWYILLDGAAKGPYSFYELRANREITPDTLGWREGLSDWVSLKKIPELARLFDEGTPLHETEIIGSKKAKEEEGEFVAVAKQEPPYGFIWVVLLILLAIWLFFSWTQS